MKDIGYYAGFLTDSDQEAIANASLYQASELMSCVANSVFANIYTIKCDEEDELVVEFAELSTRDHLAVIRGICDRIELKLMEQAK